MSEVKIHFALGFNLFIPQFTIVNSPKLRKLSPSTIDKCAMVLVLPLAIEKLRNGGRFVNTIVKWQMLVRQSLCNLQSCGSFIVAFTSEK
jgi:hypothetical protein